MPLPKLKDINWVTTDCYGTLIDWEKGILDAFTAEGDPNSGVVVRPMTFSPAWRMRPVRWLSAAADQLGFMTVRQALNVVLTGLVALLALVAALRAA